MTTRRICAVSFLTTWACLVGIVAAVMVQR